MKYFWLTIKKMFRFLLKPLSFVPALCVMYMIFSFSAQTADESGQLSMLVSEKVVLLLGKLTSGNLDTAQVGVYVDHRIYWEKNDICTPFDGKAQRTEKKEICIKK